MNDAQRTTLQEHLAAEAERDATRAAATYVDDAFYVNEALGITFHGRDGVAFQYGASYQLIDGLSATYDWQFEGDDYCVQAGRLSGSVSGDLLGVPATGGDLDLPFVAVISFRGDRMLSEHVWYDLDEFCRQAGLDAGAVRDAVAASGLAPVS